MPLEMLQTKTRELNKIVDDLLLASRMDVDKVVDKVIRLDLRDAVRAAVERARPRAALVDAAVETRLPEVPAMVEVDPDHIGRVLDNLINNALTYCVEKPQVLVEVVAGETVLVRVRDNGVGIPRSQFENVFDRFVRLDDAAVGPVPGTGLGLYISRQLARRHGGELVLEQSEVGAGSTFTMAVPAAEAGPAAKKAPRRMRVVKHFDAQAAS
jgi:signal transduction histidine kinase